jgi:hypothetical protein
MRFDPNHTRIIYIQKIKITQRRLMFYSKYGLLISNPVKIIGNTLKIRHLHLEPQEVRHSLLFWDELVWPKTNLIDHPDHPDDHF